MRDFQEKHRAEKLQIPNSSPYFIPNTPPDIFKECQSLARDFDAKIAGLINSHGQIAIEHLIEMPGMISAKLFDYGYKDEHSRK